MTDDNEEVCDCSDDPCSGGAATLGEQVVQASYEEHGHYLRAQIKSVARMVKDFVSVSQATIPPADDSVSQNHSEMIANAMLSYRHLEDAAMRVGKSMQAFQGGVSILDKMRDEQQLASTDALPENKPDEAVTVD